MEMRNFTSIGRPIDPNYPTNRAVAILAALVALAAMVLKLITGFAILQSVIWGLSAGLAIFLTWAICRELDPDNDLSAFVAVGWALIGLTFWGLPDAGSLFWILLAVRIVNRTTGLSATIFDSLGVAAFGSWLSFQGNWGIGFFTAVAFFLDAQLPSGKQQQKRFAILSGVIATSALAIGNNGFGAHGIPLALGIALGCSVFFWPVFAGSQTMATIADDTGEALNGSRVQSGQILALGAGLEIALCHGTAGLVAMMPLWAAVLGAASYRWVIRFLGERGSVQG
jgi:hypothetical protein